MYVPALARAHLAAESVISANKVSLGLKGMAGGGQWGRPKGDTHPPATYPLLAQHTRTCMCARAYVRAHIRTYVRTCGRSFLRTRGGIIRSATINPNDDDAVMTLSRTSFQATSVTLRAHLPSFSPFSCPPSLLPSFLRHTCLPLP